MFYMHSIGWGWWLVMSIGIVVFWAAVIYGIMLLRGPSRTDAAPSSESPEQTLKRRLARGEISIDEYRQLVATIDDDQGEKAAA